MYINKFWVHSLSTKFSSLWRKYFLIFSGRLKLDRKNESLFVSTVLQLSAYPSQFAIHTPCVSLCPLCIRGMWAWWVAYTLSSALFIDKSPLSYFKVQLEGIKISFWICKQSCVTVSFLTVFTDFLFWWLEASIVVEGVKCLWTNKGEMGFCTYWLVCAGAECVYAYHLVWFHIAVPGAETFVFPPPSDVYHSRHF